MDELVKFLCKMESDVSAHANELNWFQLYRFGIRKDFGFDYHYNKQKRILDKQTGYHSVNRQKPVYDDDRLLI